MTAEEIRARADGFHAKAKELEAEQLELIGRIGEASRTPELAGRVPFLERQYDAAEVELEIARRRELFYHSLADHLPTLDSDELAQVIIRLERRAAELERMARRHQREDAMPDYQAYRDRRELAKEALQVAWEAGFHPEDFDAFGVYRDSPGTWRKLVPPKKRRRGRRSGDAADILSPVGSALNLSAQLERAKSDTHEAEAALHSLIKPWLDERKELADFLRPIEPEALEAAEELRAQARAILADAEPPSDGRIRKVRVPLGRLADVPAEEWQPSRSERIAEGIRGGLTAEAFPPIRIAARPDGTLLLDDGNHRLVAFRREAALGRPGFDPIPVDWLDVGGGPP